MSGWSKKLPAGSGLNQDEVYRSRALSNRMQSLTWICIAPGFFTMVGAMVLGGPHPTVAASIGMALLVAGTLVAFIFGALPVIAHARAHRAEYRFSQTGRLPKESR